MKRDSGSTGTWFNMSHSCNNLDQKVRHLLARDTIRYQRTHFLRPGIVLSDIDLAQPKSGVSDYIEMN